jgi:hypothetical protein
MGASSVVFISVWTLSGMPSGEPAAYAGTDFIIARDGRIAAVYLFFDKLP